MNTLCMASEGNTTVKPTLKAQGNPSTLKLYTGRLLDSSQQAIHSPIAALVTSTPNLHLSTIGMSGGKSRNTSALARVDES